MVYTTLRKILGGQESVKLFLEFLKRNNKTDMLILKHTKVRHIARKRDIFLIGIYL